MSALPLSGIRVLEIAQNLSGPYAGQILSLLGADVIKIERPDGGDDARGWGPPFWRGTATTFQSVNLNKRSVAIDLKNADDLAWLRSEASRTDVLIQNLRPGVMRELGLDATTLRAINRRLIYCSLWAFGNKGPMHLKPGYEPIVQAFAGMFNVNGTEDGPPSRVGMQVLDLGTGIWAALGCIAGLFSRSTTGEGCVVDTSLLETAFGWLTVHLASFAATGITPKRHRTGNPAVVVFQSFAASDGEIIIAAANDRLFVKLAQALGRPAWSADPRFASNALRVANKGELISQINAIIADESIDHWMNLLEAAGVPCAPINDFHQLTQHPQTDALGIMQMIPGVDLPAVGLPISFDGTRPPVYRGAPSLGEHTDELRQVERI